MSKSVVIGTDLGLRPALAYRFLGLASNSASDSTWLDRSGDGTNASRGADLAAATAWATPGFNATTAQTVGATTVPMFFLAAGVWDWTFEDSFLIFAKGEFTSPAATSALLGNSGSTSAKPGIRMRTFTTHKTDVSFTDSAGTVTTVTATTGNLSSASPSADTTAAWVFDATTRKASIYLGGAIDVADFAVPSANYTNLANPFYLGGAPSGASNFLSTAAKFRELHMLIRKGAGLPSNIAMLIEKLNAHRNVALTAEEFPA